LCSDCDISCVHNIWLIWSWRNKTGVILLYSYLKITGTCFIQKIYAPSYSLLLEGAYIFWMKQEPVLKINQSEHCILSVLIGQFCSMSIKLILKILYEHIYIYIHYKNGLISTIVTHYTYIWHHFNRFHLFLVTYSWFSVEIKFYQIFCFDKKIVKNFIDVLSTCIYIYICSYKILIIHQ
jgi:hypothetical protein